MGIHREYLRRGDSSLLAANPSPAEFQLQLCLGSDGKTPFDDLIGGWDRDCTHRAEFVGQEKVIRSPRCSPRNGLQLRLDKIGVTHSRRELPAKVIAGNRIRAADIENSTLLLLQEIEQNLTARTGVDWISVLKHGHGYRPPSNPFCLQVIEERICRETGGKAHDQRDSGEDGVGYKRGDRGFRRRFSFAINAYGTD